MLEERRELTAEHVGRGDGARATRWPSSSSATAADGSGPVLANLVSFFNPGLIVIGGGVAGLGHALLAEIRSVIYRQSLPLATGNLPVVLSELGGDAGVIGAARLISDAVYATELRIPDFRKSTCEMSLANFRLVPRFARHLT